MPTQQFFRLPKEKQQRIRQALFQEFTSYSLVDAQVARIIKVARISRGAFYNYFMGLQDAYVYLFKYEMGRIHQPLKLQKHLSAVDYTNLARKFLTNVHQQQLRRLLIFHFQVNAGILLQKNRYREGQEEVSPQQWAIKTLIHQAINEVILDPASQEHVLKKLLDVLTKLERGL